MTRKLLASLTIFGAGFLAGLVGLGFLAPTAISSQKAPDCPYLASPVLAEGCPYLARTAAPSCPSLEAVSARQACGYLAREAAPTCPFLSAHPELWRTDGSACPEQDGHTRRQPGVPAHALPDMGIVTAGITLASAPLAVTNPA